MLLVESVVLVVASKGVPNLARVVGSAGRRVCSGAW
jgi:hypothetical protein